MIKKILKDSSLSTRQQIEQKMFDYGARCAQKGKLDFSAVINAMETFGCRADSIVAYTKAISRGFCKGLSGSPKL